MPYTTADERLELFRQAFPKLEEGALRTLAETAEDRFYTADQSLCQQGELGTELYVLVAGEVAVYVRTDEHNEVLVNTGLPVSYFGEMALLVENTPRSASIRAIADSHVLTVERETFLAVADRNPVLLRRLASQLTDHLRNNDRAVINELRQKNNAVEEAYRDLATQEKMRREFVTTLSHELRTPLTSIQGYLQLMHKGVIRGDSLPVALDSITRNVEKMVAMTNNMLVLYEMQLSSPEFAELDLVDVVVEAVRRVQSTPDYAQAEISAVISPTLPHLHGDKNGLVLALHALLENAAKFSPAHTPVELRAQMGEDGGVWLDVVDKGVGIPTAEQEKIFEPFYRLEHVQKGGSTLFAGIGIGLSIAKFIVERHGGRIVLTSTPGKGSTFSIRLPK